MLYNYGKLIFGYKYKKCKGVEILKTVKEKEIRFTNDERYENTKENELKIVKSEEKHTGE